MSERKEKKKKKLDLASLSPLSHPLPRRQPLSRAPSCRRPLTPKPDDEPRVSSIQYHYRPGTISAFFSRALARHASRRRSRAPVRVYMDGCFDMMHYGHANALRQAKALGDVLVVGLIPDSQIRMYKVSCVFLFSSSGSGAKLSEAELKRRSLLLFPSSGSGAEQSGEAF